ncbi:hypothetical protein ACH9EU_07840 [Kocuria sp. M1R5S2]|uniref:hypothetical protein n=1 Tax=Kocuria rhizosphaerae TaxID=3376285 RepID=UPI0037AB785B
MSATVPRTPESRHVPHRAGADPAHTAFVLLRVGFTVLPIVLGLDKFTNILTTWENYLAPWAVDLLPVSAHTAMLVVGVVEVLAGVLVAIRPRIGAYVVALWLAGIVVNLLSFGYYDIALRDVGLLVGALALGLLAGAHDRPRRAG